jgi:hypothetical protein
VDAVTAAQRRFRLSADPRGSWSVAITASFSEPVDSELVQERAREISAREPALGPAADVHTAGGHPVSGLVESFCSTSYAPGGPAYRVAVSGSTILVAVHHGVADGLGLLGLLGELTGRTIRSSARGLPERPGYGRRAPGLLRKLTRPSGRPERRGGAGAGGTIVSLSAEIDRPLTEWISASCRELVPRLDGTGAPLRVAVGASLRPGSTPVIEDRSAFLEIEPEAPYAGEEISALLRNTQPKTVVGTPALAPPAALMRMAGARLGPTILVSSLAAVTDEEGTLREVAFFPVAYGRSGLAIGLASVDGLATVSLRSANGHLGRGELQAILAGILGSVANHQ